MTQGNAVAALEIERAVLRDLAFAAPVSATLERICALVEERVPGAICSVMLRDADGALRIAAAPTLPRDLWTRLDGLVPGPARGSCGRAAATGRPVHVEDTHIDPVWEDLRPLARELGIRACWSHPIIAAGEVLGTFAISHPTPRVPGAPEEELLATATRLAVVAIESDRARRSQQALERRLHHSQKLEALGRRAGEVAHDLGNLLTVILAGTDALRGAERSPDPAAVRELAIDQIRGAGKRAAVLIRQLLRFGRGGAREERWIDPAGAIAEIEPMLRRFVHERIRCRFVLPDRPLEVAADPAEFQQMATNLVVNAAESMPEGGDLAVTLVEAAGEGGTMRLLLEVRDTGCGIPAEARARLFEPFFTTKGGERGVGLGLSSVRSTVERLGGRIEVESEVGVGSVFRVSLPARSPASDRASTPAAPDPRGAPISAALAERPVEETESRARVLLCEDDALVRTLLAETMRAGGLEVDEAATGTEAVELASRTAPDLVVCDVVMPGLDGPTLLARLRTARPELPCVFISGYPRDVIERSFARRGIAPARPGSAEFLEKPFSPSELLATVERALALREGRAGGVSGMAQRSDSGAPVTDR